MTRAIRNFIMTAALTIAAAAISPEARATDVVLNGTGTCHFGGAVNYYKQGIKQGGRYKNLGADDYRKATTNFDYVTNRSKKSTGALSLEFWALPFKGATSGIVLMTKGLDPMPGKEVYKKVVSYGYAIYLDERKFPEFELWEHTKDGWEFRDAVVLSKKRKL